MTSKARTLASTVSTGAVLADGTVNASEIGSLTLPTGGDIVGTTSTQTLTNKTINIANNTLTGVQASLVSGTNIKTVNSTSLLGSGDVAVQPTLVSGTNIKTVNSTSLLGSGDIAIPLTSPAGTTGQVQINNAGAFGAVGSGTSGQVLTSAGSGAAPMWADPAGGGSLIFLSEVTANNSNTVNIETTFNSTYDEYVIKVTNLMPAESNTGIRARVRIDGSYDTGSNYSSASTLTTSGGDSYTGNDGGTTMFITTDVIGANRPTSFEFLVHSPASTTFAKGFNWSGFGYRNGATLASSFIGAGLNSNTLACTGVRFYMTSGAITSGTFRLYGIKKS